MDATTQRDALEAARELARANKHMQARALLRRQFEAVARDDHTQTKPEDTAGPHVHPVDAAVAAATRDDTELRHTLRLAAAVDRLREDLGSTDGWQLARRDGNTTTYMQVASGSSLARVRVEGAVAAPALQLLAVLHEVALHPVWMPHAMGVGVREGCTRARLGLTKLWIEVDVDVPWPLSDRRASLIVDGVDCLDIEPEAVVVGAKARQDGDAGRDEEEGKGEEKEGASQPEGEHSRQLRQVVVLMQSVETAQDVAAAVAGARLPDGFAPLDTGAAPTTGGAVLAGIELGGFILTPAELNPGLGLPPGGTLVQLAARIDPRMSVLPTCAINIGIKHLAHHILEAMSAQALCVADDARYKAAMAQTPEFYAFIEGRMAEALEQERELAAEGAAAAAAAVNVVAVAEPKDEDSVATSVATEIVVPEPVDIVTSAGEETAGGGEEVVDVEVKVASMATATNVDVEQEEQRVQQLTLEKAEGEEE